MPPQEGMGYDSSYIGSTAISFPLFDRLGEAKATSPGQSDEGAAPWVHRPHGFRPVWAKAKSIGIKDVIFFAMI